MPKTKQKDPEKVAAAYKGLMPKTVTSPRWKLIPEDYVKWTKDIFIFFVPAMIVAIGILQNGGSMEDVRVAVYVWLLSALMNLLQKLATQKTYVE